MQEVSSQRNPRTNGRWTPHEHLLFLQGLRIYGKNWKKIELLLKTRTGTQIRSHAQKFFLKNGENNSKSEGESSSGEALQKQSVEESSKVMGGRKGQRRESNGSYYLSRILQHSTFLGAADFWEALVDSKQHSSHQSSNPCKHSFELYNKEPHSIAPLQ